MVLRGERERGGVIWEGRGRVGKGSLVKGEGVVVVMRVQGVGWRAGRRGEAGRRPPKAEAGGSA
jgi:hypothetical protein